MASPRKNVAVSAASTLHDPGATLSSTTQAEAGNSHGAPISGTNRSLHRSQRYRDGRASDGLGTSSLGHHHITAQALPIVLNPNFPSIPVAYDTSSSALGYSHQDTHNGSEIVSPLPCVHVTQSTELHSPIPRLPPQIFSQPWLNAPQDHSTPNPQGRESFSEPFPLNLANMDTLAQRISILSDDDYSIFNSCGQNVSVQKAVLTILESNEHKERKCIGYRLALPLLQQVPYSQTNGRDGKRGAPEKYRCLWHGCDWENKRKLRGLEHIRSHVKNRPFICEICSKGFIRKNELVNHRGCRGPETTSTPILRNIAPQAPGMSRYINLVTVTTNREQPALHMDNSQRTPQNYELGNSAHTNVGYQQFIPAPTALSLSQTGSTQFTSETDATVASQTALAYFWPDDLQNTTFVDQSVRE